MLRDGTKQARRMLILARGTGQGMDSPIMHSNARRIAAGGTQVIRLYFPYMMQRIQSGPLRPPDREPVRLADWRQVFEQLRTQHPGPLFSGVKSIGGRMASLLADEQQVAGLICLGYPSHPPDKTERLL